MMHNLYNRNTLIHLLISLSLLCDDHHSNHEPILLTENSNTIMSNIYIYIIIRLELITKL